MFLKNKNIIFKSRRSKVTDYAALTRKTYNKMILVNRQMSKPVKAIMEQMMLTIDEFGHNINPNGEYKVWLLAQRTTVN